jgi:hypothetical protein
MKFSVKIGRQFDVQEATESPMVITVIQENGPKEKVKMPLRNWLLWAGGIGGACLVLLVLGHAVLTGDYSNLKAISEAAEKIALELANLLAKKSS